MDVEDKLANLEERIEALELDFDLLKDRVEAHHPRCFSYRVNSDGVPYLEPCRKEVELC